MNMLNQSNTSPWIVEVQNKYPHTSRYLPLSPNSLNIWQTLSQIPDSLQILPTAKEIVSKVSKHYKPHKQVKESKDTNVIIVFDSMHVTHALKLQQQYHTQDIRKKKKKKKERLWTSVVENPSEGEKKKVKQASSSTTASSLLQIVFFLRHTHKTWVSSHSRSSIVCFLFLPSQRKIILVQINWLLACLQMHVQEKRRKKQSVHILSNSVIPLCRKRNFDRWMTQFPASQIKQIVIIVSHNNALRLQAQWFHLRPSKHSPGKLAPSAFPDIQYWVRYPRQQLWSSVAFCQAPSHVFHQWLDPHWAFCNVRCGRRHRTRRIQS